MAKLKAPLISFGASGSIGSQLTLVKRGGLAIARAKTSTKDPETTAQLSKRAAFKTITQFIAYVEAGGL